MFDKILKQLSFTPADSDLVRDKAVIWLQEYRKQQSTEIKNCVDQIKAINQKIRYLQVALLNGVISTSVYNRTHADCSLHKAHWEAVASILMKEQLPVLNILNRVGEMLMHLNEVFTTCGEVEKFKLMKLIFPEALEFDGPAQKSSDCGFDKEVSLESLNDELVVSHSCHCCDKKVENTVKVDWTDFSQIKVEDRMKYCYSFAGQNLFFLSLFRLAEDLSQMGVEHVSG
ncbi:hypothetical protein [Chitinophaga sp. Ak27]|uniref:hypothetical protein n=1 Tax=Chitinophaga sp. Ak27 TaxID=2726116 RepID=UPI00145D38A8|nr:hypothetical protein [Chitinophaga sp. Ak27]NLU95674.1 hypothetical protein [Chitinophaga sp. Ak27]